MAATADEFIPVNTPSVSGRAREYVLDCVESGWISSGGSYVQRFEEAMAARLGRRYAIALCNGTAALQVAVDALRLQPGDEVILPSFTIISCVVAILRAGAVPVVIDAEPDTWNMAVAQVEARITPRTRAIMAVHIYGLPNDMQPLLELVQRHGLELIEDASQGMGISYHGRPGGSFGALSTLSFYPNKIVTTGEGGMVLTDDPALAERCRSLRDLCFVKERRFVHEELGWNYRMTALQAAVGLAQAEQFDHNVERRRFCGEYYRRAFSGLRDAQLPLSQAGGVDNIYWVFGLVLHDHLPADAVAVMGRLRQLGIETRPFFWPMHQQPALRARGLFAGERLPVSERLARRGFYLPGGSGISDATMDRVVAAVRQVLQ
jgi:perosamine synthetase